MVCRCLIYLFFFKLLQIKEINFNIKNNIKISINIKYYFYYVDEAWRCGKGCFKGNMFELFPETHLKNSTVIFSKKTDLSPKYRQILLLTSSEINALLREFLAIIYLDKICLVFK